MSWYERATLYLHTLECPQRNPKCVHTLIISLSHITGNKRASEGLANPSYTSTYVFQNDFSALLPPTIPGDDVHNSATSGQPSQDDLESRLLVTQEVT
jgi:hypothetical protein